MPHLAIQNFILAICCQGEAKTMVLSSLIHVTSPVLANWLHAWLGMGQGYSMLERASISSC
jgi:hypothetical protein